MHSMRGLRGLIGGAGFVIAALLAMPTPAHAGPDPEARRAPTGRYQLFAGNLGAITVNQLYYGLNTRGEVGVDSTNSSTVGGGFWPKGTGNQYMFNSGLQVAGIIQGDAATNPWAGDTTGGMFFDASGLRQHGTAASPLFNATNPSDVAEWPQAGLVPQGDASEDLFDPLLRGRVSASQGDVWFLTTEADPGLNAARPHPLGIVAEYRVMGWNYPTGNEDLIYLIITFYNVSTNNPAAYAQYRPGLRERLIEQADKFQELNNAKFGITLPTAGYTIDPFYAAFAADPDVTTDAGTNFSSVNFPFAMGYAYHADFPRADGWTFSPALFGPPFFAGAGFVGVKYLKSATGPGEINLFSNTTNGGPFPDPNSAVRLYKYLSGTVTPADGVECNVGDVAVSKICYISQSPRDVRLLESSTPFALEAGNSASIVVSYIHAAPLKIAGFSQGTRVGPGDPRVLTDPVALALGANTVDSIMGFDGYSDGNGDGVVEQNEITTVPGSLLNKALLAQTIFDNRFLLPFAPTAPEFFLVPTDGQVTVAWRPSSSETEGDPFFEVAKDASVVPPGGGAPVVNTLYDANYRQFDVEGYRIYRGRSDNAASLQLIAQYDYKGTVFSDYTGQVAADARGSKCAPELGVTTSCAGDFDPQTPGVQLVKHIDYDISGNLVQVRKGDRTLLASGDVINLAADTAVTGGGTGFPNLSDNDVPFVFVDKDVHNGLRYFYAVTAFDINSINSTGPGNTSLKSAKITKTVTPDAQAGDYNGTAQVVSGIFGRSGALTDREIPRLDPKTGIFSKKQPPADAWSNELLGLGTAIIKGGQGGINFRMDSVQLGDPNHGDPHIYYLTLFKGDDETAITLPIAQSFTTGRATNSSSFSVRADPDLSALYGGGDGYFAAAGKFSMYLDGAYYYGVKMRGCVNGAGGFGPPSGSNDRHCYYNGSVWFEGNQQTEANPFRNTYDAWETGLDGPPSGDLTNAGHLTGIKTNFEPQPYVNQAGGGYRPLAGVLSGALSAADYKLYWGEGGAVDSVIDVTHDVPVPFTGGVGLTWGILNQSATTAAGSYDERPDVLTPSDLTCVPGFRDQAGVRSTWACDAPPYMLSQTAVPGTIAFGRNSNGDQKVRAPAANPGFMIYLKGHYYLMELDGGSLPAAGTVWTMRDYIGAIRGGNGASGDFGDYSYTPKDRPFTAAGAQVGVKYEIGNEKVASSKASMEKIHTVPDPYYVTSPFEATTIAKAIDFVNLPTVATIRIYTTSGVLVRVLKHNSTSFGGKERWDVRNRNNQFVASGVYFYHVTADNGETFVGRMTIINYAP